MLNSTSREPKNWKYLNSIYLVGEIVGRHGAEFLVYLKAEPSGLARRHLNPLVPTPTCPAQPLSRHSITVSVCF